MNLDLLSLKLHVDNNGEVWYVNGDGPPIFSGLPVIAFMLQPIAYEIPRVRLIGLHQNVQLTLALFLQRMKAGQGLVEICSPLACKTSAERNDPVRALAAMRQYERATSAGGWHTFHRDDYASYSLISHIQKYGNNDKAVGLLEKHPVWPPLSFIPHLNKSACCELLSLIMDPRWYVSPTHMGRGSKLKSFLGLNRENMWTVLSNGKGTRHFERCALVFNCWYNKDDREYIEQPEYFLWRIMRQHIEKKDIVTGYLRASQAFVDFLRLTWLASIGRGHKQTEALFVPTHYFKLTTEVEAFYEHFTRLFGDK